MARVANNSNESRLSLDSIVFINRGQSVDRISTVKLIDDEIVDIRALLNEGIITALDLVGFINDKDFNVYYMENSVIINRLKSYDLDTPFLSEGCIAFNYDESVGFEVLDYDKTVLFGEADGIGAN